MTTCAAGRFSQRLAARDGFLRGLGPRVAKGECGAQKHHGENRPHCAMLSLHQLSLLGPHYSAKPYRRERHVVSPQGRGATQTRIAGGVSRMKLRLDDAGAPCPDL